MARLLASLLLVALVGFAAPPARAADDPAVQQPIDQLHAALLEAMKAGKSMSFADREKKLDPVVRAAFDLPYMAEVSAGRYWKDMTGAQRTSFVALGCFVEIIAYTPRVFVPTDRPEVLSAILERWPAQTLLPAAA